MPTVISGTLAGKSSIVLAANNHRCEISNCTLPLRLDLYSSQANVFVSVTTTTTVITRNNRERAGESMENRSQMSWLAGRMLSTITSGDFFFSFLWYSSGSYSAFAFFSFFSFFRLLSTISRKWAKWGSNQQIWTEDAYQRALSNALISRFLPFHYLPFFFFFFFFFFFPNSCFHRRLFRHLFIGVVRLRRDMITIWSSNPIHDKFLFNWCFNAWNHHWSSFSISKNLIGDQNN